MRTHAALIDVCDRATWKRLLDACGPADVYYQAEYHAAHQANGDGTPVAYAFTSGDAILFHPVMLRSIPADIAGADGWNDMETVYGYAGPLSTSSDPGFLTDAWAAYRELALERHAVAEFIRCHPLLDSHRFLTGFATMVPERETRELNLSGTEEDLWNRYSSTHRNMIRKAVARGIETEILPLGECLGTFVGLYHQWMAALGAGDYYFFEPKYFDALAQDVSDQSFVVLARLDGQIVAAGLFLMSSRYLHYHLAATSPDGRRMAASNLVLHRAASHGQVAGLSAFHLGGGRTTAPGDHLLKFKASVGPTPRTFHIGKVVHDSGKYGELCLRWRQRHPGESAGGYHLLYRKPDVSVDHHNINLGEVPTHVVPDRSTS